MVELTLSAISLLILFLIIYFLPIKITKVGKISLIFLAFLLANVGLLSREILQLWQIALVLFLLVFLIVYILDKRFSQKFYLSEKSAKATLELLFQQEIASAKEDNILVKDDNLNEQNVHSSEHELSGPKIEQEDQLEGPLFDFKKDNSDDEVLEKIAETSFENNDIDENLNHIDMQFYLKEGVKETDEETDLNESSIVPNKDKANEISFEKADDEAETGDNIDIDDEISFLLNRQVDIDDEVENSEEEIQPPGYLSEIEKLLENDNFFDSERELESDEKNDFNDHIDDSHLNLLESTNLKENDDIFDFDMLLAEKRASNQEPENENKKSEN